MLHDICWVARETICRKGEKCFPRKYRIWAKIPHFNKFLDEIKILSTHNLLSENYNFLAPILFTHEATRQNS